jgi:hypothetical protein
MSRSGSGFAGYDDENYARVTTTDGIVITIGTYNLEPEYIPHPELIALLPTSAIIP